MNDADKGRHISRLKRQLCERKIDRREFLRTSTLLGLSAGAAYAFVSKVTGGYFVDPARAADLPHGGTIRIGNRVDAMQDVHAIQNIQSGILIRQVYDFLTDTGYDNVTRPSLLKGWQPSDDLRTWTLYLRQDVKWTSGRRFVADDVVWNLKHALDEATGSSQVGLMKGYMLEEYEQNGTKHTRLWDANAIEKVDDFTVRLNCKVPQVAVPEHLFHYAMVIADPADRGQFRPGVGTTGPFQLADLQTGSRAVFRPNKGYWGEGPYVDELQIVHLADNPAAAVAAMASGQIEGLYSANINNLAPLSKIPHLKYYTAKTATTMVARGRVDAKPWSDARVRRALRLATDQAPVAKVAARGGTIAQHHHVSEVHPEYAPLPEFKRDVTAAKQLLAEAGYPDGLDLECRAASDETWMIDALQVMVRQWAEAGIRVKITVMPGATFWDNWTTHPFSVTNWNHRPLGIMVLGLAYRSGVPWNESGYSNAEFDRLLSKAEGLIDVDKRRAVMKDIETLMQQDGPITQPFWTTIFTFYHEKVLGFQMHPSYYIYGNRLAVAT